MREGQESSRCPTLSLFPNTQVSNQIFELIGNKLNTCFFKQQTNSQQNVYPLLLVRNCRQATRLKQQDKTVTLPSEVYLH